LSNTHCGSTSGEGTCRCAAELDEAAALLAAALAADVEAAAQRRTGEKEKGSRFFVKTDEDAEQACAEAAGTTRRRNTC